MVPVNKTLVIFCINARYLTEYDSDQPVGASSFIYSLDEYLSSQEFVVRYIAFRRSDNRPLPSCEEEFISGKNVHIINFNYNMDASSIRECISNTVTKITNKLPMQIIFWYQSIAFLHFHPYGIPALVTNHAPFVFKVRELFGEKITKDAFQDKAGKTEILDREQKKGLLRLKDDKLISAVEMSQLQGRVLLVCGIPQDRINYIEPLFFNANTYEDGKSLKADVDWCNREFKGLMLITCCSRMDGFKNIQELLNAFDRLNAGGKDIYLFIAAGSHEDIEKNRKACLQQMNPRWIYRFRFRNRFGQKELISFFHSLRNKAFFVFPSVYETFGITPVQASIAGMPVIARGNIDKIGCLHYLSETLHFDDRDDGLYDYLLDAYERRYISPLYLKPVSPMNTVRSVMEILEDCLKVV